MQRYNVAAPAQATPQSLQVSILRGQYRHLIVISSSYRTPGFCGTGLRHRQGLLAGFSSTPNGGLSLECLVECFRP